MLLSSVLQTVMESVDATLDELRRGLRSREASVRRLTGDLAEEISRESTLIRKLEHQIQQLKSEREGFSFGAGLIIPSYFVPDWSRRMVAKDAPREFQGKHLLKTITGLELQQTHPQSRRLVRRSISQRNKCGLVQLDTTMVSRVTRGIPV